MTGQGATKTVKESRVVLAQHMGVTDANVAGAVHGGAIMKLVDTAGGLAATKFSGTPVVTAAIDELSFLEPVQLGDLVTVTASVNGVGGTSMEVGVKVETENVLTGERAHTSTAYLLYVALDPETREPCAVPGLVCESPEERRRQRQAKARRKARIAHREAKLEERTKAEEAERRNEEKAAARRQARREKAAARKAREQVAAVTAPAAQPEPPPVEEVRRWRRQAPEPPPEPAMAGSPGAPEPGSPDLTKWRSRSS